MNIIVDGYNIIKQIFSKSHVSDNERAWFLRRLTEYAAKKGHQVYLVFDGGPYERPTVERSSIVRSSSARSSTGRSSSAQMAGKKGMVVKVYSGHHLSADDVIKTYIEEKLLVPMLVVTTDRQINRYAARNNVPSIDSLDFYKLMNEEEPVKVAGGLYKVPGAAQKLHEDEGSRELDELMQEASSVLLYKEEDESDQKGSKSKSPKQEREMLRILKKL